ncbi:hypothetical protein [Secundilactobacillus mixtipabuli]|uniref:Uncharacterized protein n=1 Tax=Secundilactobacillus mixtipabuli TaxID=1435342 RepID=A0A1Z5ICS9_9LACO|nr:hypothetical protein [Secundilactobacillus mixtipabuli]GAW99586.1 hypothetical protein IWT30_01556 [Secundilactobacillus mixtipabuli]
MKMRIVTTPPFIFNNAPPTYKASNDAKRSSADFLQILLMTLRVNHKSKRCMEQFDCTTFCFPYVPAKGKFIMNNEKLEELATALMQETVMILDEITKLNDTSTSDFYEIRPMLEQLNCDLTEVYLKVTALLLSCGQEDSIDRVTIGKASDSISNNLESLSDSKKEM